MARDRVTFIGWNLGALVVGAEVVRRGDTFAAVVVGSILVVVWVRHRSVLG